MPYAERNQDGIVIALYAAQNDQAREFLTGNHPEVAAFLADAAPGQHRARMQASDMEMARVVDDVVLLVRFVMHDHCLPPLLAAGRVRHRAVACRGR